MNPEPTDQLDRASPEVVHARDAYHLALRHVNLNLASVLLAYHAGSHGTGEEVSGADPAYRKFLTEMALVGLANGVETALLDIERETEASFNVWDEPSYELLHHEQAKLVRTLHHIVKHNGGIVAGNSLAGRLLMDQYGAAEGTEIGALSLNIPSLFCRNYLFLLDLLRNVTGIEHPFLALPEDEQAQQIASLFLPEASGGTAWAST